MAKKTPQAPPKPVDLDLVAEALAKAVCDGDIVNLRLLFTSLSPARAASDEDLDSDKYAYLVPDESMKRDPSYAAALDAVRQDGTWQHIQRELKADRPAQLPSDLLLMLADNAVRKEKYTAAAQAYELLRIRNKMQQEFLKQADDALTQGEIDRAVRGYLIAVALSYDYAAFPEPLPSVPNYQTKALMLHGVYPTRSEDCVALHDEDAQTNTALQFLLQDEDIAARLRSQPLATRLEFLNVLVRRIDPEWEQFARRYREACALTQDYGQRLKEFDASHSETLEEQIEDQQKEDPRNIMIALIGREIPDGEWWQYLKELGYEHPAGVVFVARQVIGEHEIIMPRLRAGSSLPKMLDLVSPAEASPA